MKSNPRYAVVQMRSGSDVWENLALIDAFVSEAEIAGATAVFFPENALFRGPSNLRDSAILAPGTEVFEALRALSQSWKMTVFLGSVLERSEELGRPYNCTLRMGLGRMDFLYRKIHLFDFVGEQAVYRESERVSPGDEVACVAVDGTMVGLSICFDLRFPELYRRLALKGGAKVFNIPAAFTFETGLAHWHSLLRARAIENLAFVMAPAQWGEHVDSGGGLRRCFGHSLFYSPWGELLAEAPADGDALLICDLDLAAQAKVRTNLPCLSLTRLL
jgi:predicted amidohydrolase